MYIYEWIYSQNHSHSLSPTLSQSLFVSLFAKAFAKALRKPFTCNGAERLRERLCANFVKDFTHVLLLRVRSNAHHDDGTKGHPSIYKKYKIYKMYKT